MLINLPKAPYQYEAPPPLSSALSHIGNEIVAHKADDHKSSASPIPPELTKPLSVYPHDVRSSFPKLDWCLFPTKLETQRDARSIGLTAYAVSSQKRGHTVDRPLISAVSEARCRYCRTASDQRPRHGVRQPELSAFDNDKADLADIDSAETSGKLNNKEERKFSEVNGHGRAYPEAARQELELFVCFVL